MIIGQIAISKKEFEKMDTLESCLAAVEPENIKIKSKKGYVVINLEYNPKEDSFLRLYSK